MSFGVRKASERGRRRRRRHRRRGPPPALAAVVGLRLRVAHSSRTRVRCVRSFCMNANPPAASFDSLLTGGLVVSHIAQAPRSISFVKVRANPSASLVVTAASSSPPPRARSRTRRGVVPQPALLAPPPAGSSRQRRLLHHHAAAAEPRVRGDDAPVVRRRRGTGRRLAASSGPECGHGPDAAAGAAAAGRLLGLCAAAGLRARVPGAGWAAAQRGVSAVHGRPGAGRL
jgi:hypothetical protein